MITNRKVRRAMKAIGLGDKEPQDQSSIQKEYFQSCAAAGELQYKIGEFQAELKNLNDKIRKLNQAYTQLLAEQKSGGGEPQSPPSQPKENA